MQVNGRSPSGKRVMRWIKRSNARRYSILPAISLDGVLAMTVREGSINCERFEVFLEFQLVSLFPNTCVSGPVLSKCPEYFGHSCQP